ncbi:MAG: hypothetical protein ABI637_07680 [Gemmatimonadota bacterium]
MSAPSPFTEPVPATPDPLGLVAAAVPLGILVGLLLVTATVLVVTLLRDVAIAAPAPAADLRSSPAFYVLVGGTFASAFFAATAVWFSLAPITNTYRRAMFSLVSAFATIVVMLVAAPVHAAFGRPGLIGLALVCVAGITLLARRVFRIRALA